MFINVLGNAIGTIVIGKWENDFDTEQARKVLHARTTTPPQDRVGHHQGRRRQVAVPVECGHPSTPRRHPPGGILQAAVHQDR